MNTLRNQILDILDGKIQFTKSSIDLDWDFRINGRESKNKPAKYYYPKDEILFSDSLEDLEDYEKKFGNEDQKIDDEKLKDDILLERSANDVKKMTNFKKRTDDKAFSQNGHTERKKNTTQNHEKNYEDGVEDTKLNSKTEQTIKEPDPDEKNIDNNKKYIKKHPL